MLTLDLTALTAEVLGRGAALSAALGAAACALAGLGPMDRVIRAVREELADLRLAPEAIDTNIAVARRAYASLSAVPVRSRPLPVADEQVRAPVYAAGPECVPAIHAPGNSPRRHTGSWRIFRPDIDRAACTRCGICFALCPDGAIALDASAFPVIDYDNCKGCMMCYEACPIHCIGQRKEERPW